MAEKPKPILCADFDGVLHLYSSGWKGARNIPDDPVPGAIPFLLEARESFRIAILSSRSHQLGGRWAMRRWLRREIANWLNAVVEGQPGYDRMLELGAATYEPWYVLAREEAARIVRSIDFPKHKPPAMVTLDDRAITFDGAWPEIEALRQFRPWNRRMPTGRAEEILEESGV